MYISVHVLKICLINCTEVVRGMLLTTFINYSTRNKKCTQFPLYRSGKGYADDYYLDAKSQCAGGRGACPDR